MPQLRMRQSLFTLLCLSPLIFASACNSSTPSTTTGSSTSIQTKSTPTPTPSPTPTPLVTQHVPPTQTDCPAQGTARALVTAPLAQGNDPQVVYAPNQDASYSTVNTHIERYDTVTKQSVDILDFSSPREVYNVFLGLNGQWVFIVSEDVKAIPPVSPEPDGDLQAVRIDGEGFQTLYCHLNSAAKSLSPDGHWLVFNGPHAQYPGAPDTISILDTTTGNIQLAVSIPEQASATAPYSDPYPLGWISNTQVYLSDNNLSTSTNTYLLDVTQVKNQTLSSLPIVTNQKYNTADTDGTNLYMSLQLCQDSSTGCSSANPLAKSVILQMPTHGGSVHQIYENTQLAINQVRVVNAQTLLFWPVWLMIITTDPPTLTLWTINADGSNAKELMKMPMTLKTSAYFQLENVSPDGTQFILNGILTSGSPNAEIYIGNLQDGSLTPIPTALGGTVGGWTRL